MHDAQHTAQLDRRQAAGPPTRRGSQRTDRRLTLALGALLALTSLGSSLAQRYATGQEVMDAVSDQSAPDTTIATLSMTITAASGHSLTREMQIWTTTEGPRQLIKFTAPADVRGSGFMSLSSDGGASESWIYLPALDRVRRVAGGQEQDAFFGSDFSYEEISGLSSGSDDESEYELLRVEDELTYVVAGTPSAASTSSYDRIVYFVPEALLLPTRIEFYAGGELRKVMTISDTVEQDGYLLPTTIRMETVAAGSSTTLVQTGFQLDVEIEDEVFSERFLRR